jgi:hypothetical protein
MAMRALQSIVFALSAFGTLGAQRAEAAFGVTLDQPADVNLRPRCTELAVPCISPKTVPDAGIVVQGVVRATENLALVAEAGVYDNEWVPPGGDRSTANHVRAALAGIQLSTGVRVLAFGRSSGLRASSFRPRADTTRYRAFVQFLAGPEASSVVPTRMALQPGIGFDGKLGWAPGWIRVTYDYRYTRGAGRNLSGSRVLCALVIAPASARAAP